MVSGFIADLYVTLPGSNALRTGHINAVRLVIKHLIPFLKKLSKSLFPFRFTTKIIFKKKS